MKHRDFPLSKLLSLLFRQLAKPMSEKIVSFAKEREYVRYYGLIVPGRIYNRLEVNAKRYLMNNVSKDGKLVEDIGENEAMEIGAQLVLETLVFAMLASFLLLENNRSSKRNELTELQRARELEQLEENRAKVFAIFSRQAELIHELRTKVDDYSLETRS